MRKLIAWAFMYSLDGLLADEGTEFWKFCFDLPEIREPDDPAQLDFLQSAYAHIMGRTAYEAIAGSMTTSTDHPFAGILNAARKVVFSRTLKTDGGFWDGSLLIRGAHPFCYEDRCRESQASLVLLLDASKLMEFTRGDSGSPRHGQRLAATRRGMRPKLHVLQGEGVGGNTMPTRRVEVTEP